MVGGGADADAAAGAALGGAGVAIRAVRSWARIERALRLSEPLPPPNGLYVVAVAVVVAAAVIVGIALGGLLSA